MKHHHPNVPDILTTASTDQFWGKIVLVYSAGQVVRIVKEESLLIEQPKTRKANDHESE